MSVMRPEILTPTVTPYAGARVEITNVALSSSVITSHPSRVRELKLKTERSLYFPVVAPFVSA